MTTRSAHTPQTGRRRPIRGPDPPLLPGQPAPRADREDEIAADEQPDQPILSVRVRIDEHETIRFIQETLEDIRAYMHEHDINPAGPPFSICQPADQAGLADAEAGWPLDRPVEGSGRIHSGALPRGVARGRTGRVSH